jgi:hypothetical protein
VVVGDRPDEQLPSNSVRAAAALTTVAATHLRAGPVPAPSIGIDPITSGLRRPTSTATRQERDRGIPGHWPQEREPLGLIDVLANARERAMDRVLKAQVRTRDIQDPLNVDLAGAERVVEQYRENVDEILALGTQNLELRQQQISERNRQLANVQAGTEVEPAVVDEPVESTSILLPRPGSWNPSLVAPWMALKPWLAS